MIRRIYLILCLTAALSLTARLGAAASGAAREASDADDGTLPALTAIAGQGAMNSHSYEFLEELSDDVGGRVTGSPQAAEAISWSVEKMKAIGLENVHTESWKMKHGWTRISADAELVSPARHRLKVDSLGWVGSTPAGGVEAEVVPVNAYALDEEVKENSSHWAGKILLMVHRGAPFDHHHEAFARFGTFLKSAYAAHAAAVIGGQSGAKATGMNLTHTGALGFDTFYEIPVVSMAYEDQDQLERFLDRGKMLRIKLNVQNHVTDGPVDSANVVGEIRGTQNPEQIVVVGGHLDSWDLAEGTTDNGVGTTATLGAAEAIVKSGFKPRRTLRFILFTGEEEGLLGSLAYTKTHKNEMANHVAAVVLDSGQGPVSTFNLGGRGDLIPTVQRFAASLRAFGDLRVDDGTEFGTDTGPFTLEGLPGINLDQDSPDYKYTHHSAADTFDKVKPDILARDSTVMALTAFWIADRPERLATPWSAERTAHMLIEKREDVELKAFGIWPFGNLGAEPEK